MAAFNSIMANIVFMPFHWAANMNVTFALARKLQQRGHRVYYLTIPDTRDRIVAQGFDWIPIFTPVFPEGELAKQSVAEAEGKIYGATEFKARLRGMCELLRKDEIGRAIRKISPDLLVISSGMPWVGIAATATGIPVLQFSSSLISVEDWSVPPFRTNLIPRDSLVSKISIMAAWKRLFWRRRFRNKAWSITAELKELALYCNFPVSKINFRVETWPRILLPELLFYPKEFDFPRSRIPERAFFVEPSIDLQRKDCDFQWSRLESDKPLVLCVLGSLLTTKAAPQAAKFFQNFLDAIRERPFLQAVVVIGHYLKAEDFNCPPNALLATHVPQLELLKRCVLMVGHAGFSSIKECILMGVPMLLVPMAHDGPGSAARVVYHGLGLQLDPDKVSPLTLGSHIDTLLTRECFRANVRQMSRIFAELEERSPACEIIEHTLASKGMDPVLSL